MLEADPNWGATLSAHLFLQLLIMRTGLLKQIPRIPCPPGPPGHRGQNPGAAATRKLYDALSKLRQNWHELPGYAHDSQLEPDHTLLDETLMGWIGKHGK